MRTLDFLALLNMRPCDEGRAYAEEHPAPFEAIEFALNQPTKWDELYTPGAFLRWTLIRVCEIPRKSEAVRLARDLRDKAKTSHLDCVEYTRECGNILRMWINEILPR